MFRFTGLAARPSARAHEWPDKRGPAAPVRPARRWARRVPPRASARAEPLGLSFLLPPARPLAPGAWIDLVVLASGSRSRPASTPRLPIPGALARPLVCSHAHPRAAAAARPGILSKFPAPPARALRREAGGPRGERPRPPAPLIPGGKTTPRVLASACLLWSG